MELTLENLGFNETLKTYRIENGLDSFEIGRVISEHRERYVVKSDKGEFEGELIGNLRYTAEDRLDFPAVGDWVAISEYDEGKVIIHAVYPRHSILERQAVGTNGQVQIIATNIDVGLIVQAVDRDFNLNRVERYLTICNASRVKPVLLLSKTDLIKEEELAELVKSVQERLVGIPVFCISSQKKGGYHQLAKFIEKEQTYCLLGSSGVGKSTLLNNLSGREHMKTGEISSSVHKGKHITTHRELVVLDNGGILIDNPGMREVGIADASDGLEMTFDQIMDLANNCRFKDCTHQHEKGCAVLEAMDKDQLDASAYENYMKIQREKEHFESTVQEKRRKDKSLGKMIKSAVSHRKNNKF